jgi:hypothetical protein
MRTTAPLSLASLAGTWQGTASGAQGLSQPVTMMIRADGTYTVTAGVLSSQGTAQIVDGKLALSATGASGVAPSAANRAATAVLSERAMPSQTIQVLTGQGASSAGPYTFEVSRPKP